MTLISSALRSVSLFSPSSSLLSRNCTKFSCMAYSCLNFCIWSSTFISFSSFKKHFWDSEVRFAFFPSCSLFLASECDTEGISDCTGGVAAVDALADDVRAGAEQLSLNVSLVGWAATYRTSSRSLSSSPWAMGGGGGGLGVTVWRGCAMAVSWEAGDNPEEGVEVEGIGNTVVGTVGDCTGGCLTKDAASSVQFWKEIQKNNSRFYGNDL